MARAAVQSFQPVVPETPAAVLALVTMRAGRRAKFTPALCACRRCKAVQRVDAWTLSRHWEEVTTFGPALRSAAEGVYYLDAAGRAVPVHNLRTSCPKCGASSSAYGVDTRKVETVRGTYSADHVCNAKCMNSKGPNCECSCGGANHGRSHA